jgi:hypothetical protein
MNAREEIAPQRDSDAGSDLLLDALDEFGKRGGRMGDSLTPSPAKIEQLGDEAREVNMKPSELFAVRVLTYQGRIEYASDEDAELIPHLQEIKERYEELKGSTDFATAGLTAKAEWLARYSQSDERFTREFRRGVEFALWLAEQSDICGVAAVLANDPESYRRGKKNAVDAIARFCS